MKNTILASALLSLSTAAFAQDTMIAPVKFSFDVSVDDVISKSTIIKGVSSPNSAHFQISFDKDAESLGIFYMFETQTSSYFLRSYGKECNGTLGKNYNINEKKFYFYGEASSILSENKTNDDAHKACLAKILASNLTGSQIGYIGLQSLSQEEFSHPTVAVVGMKRISQVELAEELKSLEAGRLKEKQIRDKYDADLSKAIDDLGKTMDSTTKSITELSKSTAAATASLAETNQDFAIKKLQDSTKAISDKISAQDGMIASQSEQMKSQNLELQQILKIQKIKKWIKKQQKKDQAANK